MSSKPGKEEMSEDRPGWTKEESLKWDYRVTQITCILFFVGALVYTVFYFYEEWWKQNWGNSLGLAFVWIIFFIFYFLFINTTKKQLKDYLESKNKKYNFYFFF